MPAHCAEVDTEEFYLHQGVSEESMQDERPPNVTQQIQPRQTDVAGQLAVQQTQVQAPGAALGRGAAEDRAFVFFMFLTICISFRTVFHYFLTRFRYLSQLSRYVFLF